MVIWTPLQYRSMHGKRATEWTGTGHIFWTHAVFFIPCRCILESWHIHQHHHPINKECSPLPSLFSPCMLSVLSFPLAYCQCFCVFTVLHGARCTVCIPSCVCISQLPWYTTYASSFTWSFVYTWLLFFFGFVYVASFIPPFSIPWWWHLYECWNVGILESEKTQFSFVGS